MEVKDIYELLKTKKLHDKIPYSHKIKTNNKVMNLTIGKVWFNCITPDDYPLVLDQVDKKKLISIIKDIYNKYDIQIVTKFVDDINREAFKLGTINPITFDINSLVVPDFILEKKRKLLTKDLPPDKFNKIRKELAIEYLEYIKNNYSSGIYDILMSGAKGDPNLWAMLMIAKGSTTDIDGNINKPILNSLDEGLTVDEFYNSASEARFMQFFKSKGAAEPGYLARKTAFACSNIILSKEDCGTKKYLNFKVTENLANSIIGRYYVEDNQLKLIENPKDIINKEIQLRSPLYCKSLDGVCYICYGKLSEEVETDKVGLLASAMINDLGVSKSMKARHDIDKVNIKSANFIKDIIV